jgi:hypothetical protein
MAGRGDLSAAEERIRELEAQLEERDAVLAAHEGTIAARDADLDELMRKRDRAAAPPRRSFGPLVITLVALAAAGTLAFELRRTMARERAATDAASSARVQVAGAEERVAEERERLEARIRQLETRLAEPQPRADTEPAPSSASPSFDLDALRQALTVASSAAEACLGPGGRGLSTRVTVTFGPDGKVTRTTVDPPFDGSPAGNCIVRIFERAELPALEGGSITVTRVLRLGGAAATP